MKEAEVIIDTEEMAEFIYTELIERGCIPSAEDAEVLADIMFDFLLAKSIIDEEQDEERPSPKG